jgi:invasion protein IalB
MILAGSTSLVAAGATVGADSAAAASARTEVKAVDAWEVTCSYDKNDRKIGCNALLRISEGATPATAKEPAQPARVIMVWALSKANDGSLYSSFQTLSGVRIPPGVQLKMGSAPPRTVPFDSCGTNACVAIAQMDSNFVQQASAAAQVQATVQSADGRAYTATFAPKGIDKAIAVVR